MAGTKYFTAATGFWSAATNWNNSDAPTTDGTDEVYANGKTVNITIDVNVKSLNTLTTPVVGGLAGGSFTVLATSPSIRITSTTINAGTTTCITNSLPLGTDLFVIGNFSGSSTVVGGHAFNNGSTGNVYITGNSIGNTGVGVQNGSNGTIYFSGSSVFCVGTGGPGIRNGVTVGNTGNFYVIADIITGGTGSAGAGITNFGVGNMYITGNTRGGSSVSGILNNVGGTIYFVGNSSGNTGPNGSGVRNGSTGIVYITGNTIGGSSAGGYGVTNESTGGVYFLGNVTGGTAAGTAGIYSATAGIISVTGDCYSSSVSAAIENTGQTGSLTVIGNVYNLSSISAIYSYNLKVSPTNQLSFTIQDNTATSANTIFSTSGYTNILPLPQDVRSGYTYGFLSGLTGTCVIPPSQSVSVGVKVDNGSGVTTSGTSINRIIEAGAMYASFGVSGY